MNRITINIPSQPVQNQAADVVIAAIREAGLDPYKAVTVPAVPEMVKAWVGGRWTREQFIANCRKILILNPDLAA